MNLNYPDVRVDENEQLGKVDVDDIFGNGTSLPWD